MRFTKILAPEYLEVTMENFKKRLRGEDVPPYEIEIITKDGRRVPLEIRAARLEGVGEIAIACDITEQKRLEEKLREHAAKLELSDSLKGLFIDIMGHDLLNTLTVIRGVVNLLLKEPNLKEYRKHLDVLESNVDRLIKTIEDVQVYVKLRGVGGLKREEIDLTCLALEVINNYREAASAKGIEMTWELPKKCPARVNPLIRYIFDNLISNAIKYSPPQSRVEVEIKDLRADYEIRIKDYGPGIPDQFKEVIFQRFERGGKKGVKGTGLGLAIVKRVVELHGGRVHVEDNVVEHVAEDGSVKKEKKGSVFCVSIPKIEA